jgi:GTP cyclohydrolase I
MAQDPLHTAWHDVVQQLGYDTNHPHLVDSPARVAKFLRQWHTMGKPAPELTTFALAPGEVDEIVTVGGMQFYSLCAHHGLPFFGRMAIGYVPGTQLVGLSKFARVVHHFANRFQTQEMLTKEVADYLEQQLEPRALAVVASARHLCMEMRGVRTQATTVTSDVRGLFRTHPHVKQELLSLLEVRHG